MARVIDTRPQPAPRTPIFDRGALPAVPQTRMISPGRQVGGVELPPGPLLEKAVGDPHNGDFFSWDSVMRMRGAPIAEAAADGMPTMIKGIPTGAGKLPGMAAPMQPYQAGITGDPPHTGSDAGESHPHYAYNAGPLDPQAYPQGTAPGAPPMAGAMGGAGPAVPFADELSAAGMLGTSAPTQEGWIDWATMSEPTPPAREKGGQPHQPPPTAHFNPPAAPPSSTPTHAGSTSHSAAMMGKMDPAGQFAVAGQMLDQLLGLMNDAPKMSGKQGPAYGRGAGETFTYGKDDEDSKTKEVVEKSLSLDSILAPLQALIKALPVAPELPEPRVHKPAPLKKSRRARPAKEKNMDMEPQTFDVAGRALKKGLSEFKDYGDNATVLPDSYLFDYLCAFIAEAYEHENMGPQNPTAHDRLEQMACAIMGELVAYLPMNKNLVRACESVGGCNKMFIGRILVEKGLMKPASDIYDHTDLAGSKSMGAYLAEEMSYSHRVPWIQQEVAPVVSRDVVERGLEDASGLVKSDHEDPFQVIMARKAAATRALWDQPDTQAEVNASDTCPVHGGREIHKAQNLWNPMQPCTCSGKPNAHG